jgi:two-component system, OmpR family, response regulator BaeR
VNGLAEILVVEDEPKLAGLLADYLRASGFSPTIIGNGLDVEPAVRTAPPALVLLDLMLPGRDGFDVCRDLRRFTDVPIIIITARIEEIDRLLGLQLGADDYICKPFSPREVIARVKAVLRRNAPAIERDYAPPEQPAKVPGLAIHADLHRVELDGKKLDLTPLEFRLLETLAAHPGRVFSRGALMGRIYDDGRDVSDRTLDSHVKNLRRKLADAAPDRELLHTVHGIGFRLEG